MDLIVYDVELSDEIKKKEDWKKINEDWFGSAVAYSYLKDKYSFFLHRKGLQSLRKLLNQSRVVTFNGVNFDSCVVLGRTRSIIKNKEKCGLTIRHGPCSWIEYDIFIQCMKGLYDLKDDIEARKRISPGGFCLNDVAKQTIGISKIGEGSAAPKLYRKRKYDELFAYNLQDVRITKLLFDHIIIYGWILNRDRKKVKVERTPSWSINCLKKFN